MINLGVVRPGSTIYIPFESFSGSTGAPITLTGLAVGDILVYKDGGVTQRASTSGFALLDTDGIDFDALTGIHGVSIDLADNTTADFWQAGSRYFVVIGDVTVDSQTMRFIAATFTIGYPNAVLDTFIATLASQTSFTLQDGPAEDDALNGMWAVIHDAASKVQHAYVSILDYTGSTKTVTLAAGATFTVAAKDNFSVIGIAPLQPTTTGRTLTIETDGMAHSDVKEVGGTTQTAGDIIGDTNDIQTRLPAALVSGRMDSSVGAMAANVLTAAAMASDAGAEIADAVWDEALAGHVGAGSAGEAAGKLTDGTVGLAAIEALVDELETRLTAARAGYLDNLNVGGNVASAANLQLVDDLVDDLETRLPATLTELAADPGATPTARDAWMLLYMALRNKLTSTATQQKIHNNAGTVILTGALSDDGTTFTRDKFA